MQSKASAEEQRRLACLHSLNILDTPGDEAFDELAHLAAVICQTPMAAITFIAEDRQWLKASYGLAAGKSSPRGTSFCRYTIDSDDLLEVHNASCDERFSTNPAVIGSPHIRFYAGAPLITDQGERLGALCVMDTSPRQLHQDQQLTLKILAKTVVRLIVRQLEANAASISQVVASSRMVALGEMAAGIAHEINNPLAIIVGKANQTLRMLNQQNPIDESKLRANLATIEATGERIAKIIRGLRTFSRDTDGDPKEVMAVSSIIQDAMSLSQERFRNRGVELRTFIGDEPKILCRPTQITQILLNLMTNAFDAVVGSERPWVEVKLAVADSTALLSVTDSGLGIPEPVLSKLMQPFFTTKPVGMGTGLGLSISRGIAKEHGGDLSYDGSSGHTRFILRLPTCAEPASEGAA